MKHIKEFNIFESQDSEDNNCLNPESSNPKIYCFWNGQFNDLGNFLEKHTGKRSLQSWDETGREWIFNSIINNDDKVMIVMEDTSGSGWITGVYLIDDDSVIGAKNIYGERRFSYGSKIEDVIDKDSLKQFIRKMRDFRNKVI